MEGPAIELEHISVRFRLPAEPVTTLQETVVRWLQRRMRYKDFWALHDVSLRAEQGEVLGIIGRNGAGKSTLLRVVAGVIKPTVGRVLTQGRLLPLIDLTAGFDMELTGRENIFLNGALLGLSRTEMDARLDSIIEFAELPDFIDVAVRTYSSGMIMRLGFAIAVQVDPEVLLVDEVLAVGDERFRDKCTERFENVRKNGATVMIVSHSAPLIQSLCSRVVWLEQGRIAADGPADQVIDQYHAFLDSAQNAEWISKG